MINSCFREFNSVVSLIISLHDNNSAGKDNALKYAEDRIRTSVYLFILLVKL